MTGYPLEGVRVLEFGQVAAGPFTGSLLADLGADVVKVEPPEGDALRQWPPLVEDEAGERFSLNFASLNRNKRSVAADLKDEAQLAGVRELCARADVIVENCRSGVMDRLGLGFDAVSERHPGLVYCSISGFGRTSPYARRGAFDVVVQGMSGLMSVTGAEDGPPVKCGVPVGDFVAGLYAAYTIAALLPGVRERGQSVFVDCPMIDCLLGISALQVSEFWGTGVAPARLGSAHPRNAPYQAFEGSDAPFVVAAGNDRLWGEVCEATGLRELREDPRFVDQRSRAANHRELAALLRPVFATRTAAEWIARLDARGVPCGPVSTFAEILADPHVEATGLVHEIDVPVAGPFPAVVYPARIDGVGQRYVHGPPRLGADADAVFSSWGVRR